MNRVKFFVALAALISVAGAVVILQLDPWASAAQEDASSVTILAGDAPLPFVPRDEARPAPSTTTTTTAPPTTTTTAAPKPKPKPAVPKPTVKAPAASAAPVSSAESFRQCVFLRESGRNYHVGFAGGYGILTQTWHSLGRSGQAGDASPAEQDAAFWQLFAKYGKAPWSPYDGCK